MPPDPLTHARGQLNAYLQLFPAERAALQALLQQLDDGDADVFGRAYIGGHITTSGLVYDAAAAKVLVKG